MKPEKGRDKKVMDGLSNNFAEEHLKEMYGEKQDAQDEDFFPYISSALTCPVFLNQWSIVYSGHKCCKVYELWQKSIQYLYVYTIKSNRFDIFYI